MGQARFLSGILLIGVTVWVFSIRGHAQEIEVIAAGELEYQNYCAVCHGVDGRGQGIMRKYLTVPPANLRRLTLTGGGKFPFWEVYRKIDGQTEVRGHGTRDMPVWATASAPRPAAMPRPRKLRPLGESSAWSSISSMFRNRPTSGVLLSGALSRVSVGPTPPPKSSLPHRAARQSHPDPTPGQNRQKTAQLPGSPPAPSNRPLRPLRAAWRAPHPATPQPQRQ